MNLVYWFSVNNTPELKGYAFSIVKTFLTLRVPNPEKCIKLQLLIAWLSSPRNIGGEKCVYVIKCLKAVFIQIISKVTWIITKLRQGIKINKNTAFTCDTN